MKKVLKVLLWLVLGLAVAAVAAVLYLQVSGLPTYEPPQIAEIQISHDAESIANGAKIASMMCVVCHSGQDGKLSGQQVKDVPTAFGIAYSKNITQHKEKGHRRLVGWSIVSFFTYRFACQWHLCADIYAQIPFNVG